MASTTARVEVDRRTIHSIMLFVPDQALEGIDPMDEVEVVLIGRSGPLSAKKLNYRDVERLLDTK